MRLKFILALILFLFLAYWVVSHSFLIVSTMTGLLGLVVVAVIVFLLLGGRK